jgi:hypothetical protein
MRIAAAFIAIVLVVLITLTAIGRPSYLSTPKAPITSSDFWRDWVPVLMTAFFGAFLGLSEILSRYRDEPLRATWNQYGLVYIGFNAMIAIGAFVLLERYPSLLGGVNRADGVLLAFLAGFGSMAILRSKLFLYRTDDEKDIPIGPDLVIDRFLKVIVTKIDRLRGAQRQRLVFDQMRKYGEFSPTNDFFQLALTSLPNLSDDERKSYKDAANAVGTLSSSEALKAMALGYLFLDVAGEENLVELCANLDKYLAEIKAAAAAAPPPPPPPPPNP